MRRANPITRLIQGVHLNITKQQIILSMQRAFLGAICNKIRLIAFDTAEHLLTLYVYTDSHLSEHEYQAISIAVTEILADFPNFLNERIEIIKTDDNILSLNCYKQCFFMRFENQFNES